MAAIDRFTELYSDPTKMGAMDWPYVDGAAVTPHDTNELTNVSRALYVGGAGALVVVTLKGTTVTLAAVPAGTELRLRVKQVKATGTTATSIVALD
jgi:hypothetical protein